MSLVNYDLRNPQHVQRWLQKCQLPVNGRTVFFLKEQIRTLLYQKLDTLSFEDIRSMAWFHTLDPFLTPKNWKHVVVETWVPIVPMDIRIYPCSIGRPVSKKEAPLLFLESIVRMERVPNYYKTLINTEKKTFTDVIELQDIPLENVVQLKQTGELLSTTSFQELIDRNTSLWGSLENVGFKSPDGTIFGNLVSYNFDGIRFFPQKPGTLTIYRLPNLSFVPSQEVPERVIPDYFFQLVYTPFSSTSIMYTFYLPDTSEGRVVFYLMKDAFKKGNLFAFSKSGKIRHGRIHKKTHWGSTVGSSYGYPDNTYLQRVTDELVSLGSSLYTCQFSESSKDLLSSDPYPWVKEYKIKWVTS